MSALLYSVACQAQLAVSAQVEAHFRQAQKDLSENAPDLAVKEFDAVLAISPGNATALANLGAIAFLHGNCATAASDLKEALLHEPTMSKAKALLAICQRRLGDPSAQSQLQDSFAQLQDTKIRTQVGIELASSYYEQGDLAQTSSTLQALLQINPDDIEVLYMAQRIYQEMADGTLNKLAILGLHSARMQQVIAQHLINSGDATGALVHYRSALKIDPSLPGVHFEIGESLLMQSTTDSTLAEAKKELYQAIGNDGDSAKIEGQLGLIAVMGSHLEEGFQHYQRALAFNPDDTDAQLGIAKLLLETQKPKEAVPYLQKVLNADPMNTEARYRLAMAFRQLGQGEEFRKQLTLFRESKTINGQVEDMYGQMNRPLKKHPGLSPEEDKAVDSGQR